jgi:hypothetical protein
MMCGCGGEMIQSGAFRVYRARAEFDFEEVRNRASFELRCPREQIDLVVLNVHDPVLDPHEASQMGATGCGQRAVYVLSPRSGWVLDSTSSRSPG